MIRYEYSENCVYNHLLILPLVELDRPAFDTVNDLWLFTLTVNRLYDQGKFKGQFFPQDPIEHKMSNDAIWFFEYKCDAMLAKIHFSS